MTVNIAVILSTTLALLEEITVALPTASTEALLTETTETIEHLPNVTTEAHLWTAGLLRVTHVTSEARLNASTVM